MSEGFYLEMIVAWVEGQIGAPKSRVSEIVTGVELFRVSWGLKESVAEIIAMAEKHGAEGRAKFSMARDMVQMAKVGKQVRSLIADPEAS